MTSRPSIHDSGLSGAQRGLALLLSLDESVASVVLSHMTSEEVAELRSASAGTRDLDPTVLAAIQRRFADDHGAHTGGGPGSRSQMTYVPGGAGRT